MALAAGGALLVGFQPKEQLTEDEIIARGVEIKVEDFRLRQLQICRDRALKAAVTRVDSLIRAQARQQAVTPIRKPPKPQRPDFPVVRILPDSLVLDSLRRRQ
ncbi:MAG: hypothetical protein R3330_01325 [Saprospiraceae bacterium]|nr:hypothetical protein [Saprospiraceae bacterium]